MKTIFTARIMNPYRAKGRFYSKVRGHTGIDLDFRFELLPSIVTGKVLLTLTQRQMGKVMYVEDALGAIHVFAHLEMCMVGKGDRVIRDQNIAKTGDSGEALSRDPKTGRKLPHLHYEILTKKPFDSSDQKMFRTELPFKGYNCDPIRYLLYYYAKHGVDPKSGKSVQAKIGEDVPHNPHGF